MRKLQEDGSSGWSSTETVGQTEGISGGIFVINGSEADTYSQAVGTNGSEGWSESAGVSQSVGQTVGNSYSECICSGIAKRNKS